MAEAEAMTRYQHAPARSLATVHLHNGGRLLQGLWGNSLTNRLETDQASMHAL